MKTLLKIAGGLIVLLVLVAACGYGYLMFAYPKVPAPSRSTMIGPENLVQSRWV